MKERIPESIKIVGAGQLGRMLTEAAHPLGFQVYAMQENSMGSPAHQVGAIPVEGSIKDSEAIFQLADENSVVTIEIEHVDTDGLGRGRDAGHDVEPDPELVRTIQDKLHQKQWLDNAGFPVAPFTSDVTDLATISKWDDVIVKDRRGGYDGRGNYSFYDPKGYNWEEVYAESKIDFDRELSVIVARSKSGEIATYPVVETIHENNICHTVISPARIGNRLAKAAHDLGYGIASEALSGAGVFAIEMFATGNDVMVNEIAPRVHNSGHLTIEANVTSQFEQHVRAITGLPLGSTYQHVPAAVMVNILGTKEAPLDRTGLFEASSLPDTHIHFYGKSSKPARKIGHITVVSVDMDAALERAHQARAFLTEV